MPCDVGGCWPGGRIAAKPTPEGSIGGVAEGGVVGLAGWSERSFGGSSVMFAIVSDALASGLRPIDY
jgi:hypothetical protein